LSNKGDKDEQEQIQQIEDTINTKVLGDVWRLSGWRIPLLKSDKNTRAVQDITMPNCHVQKFLKSFHEIMAICFDSNIPEEKDREDAWDECSKMWSSVIKQARKR
jgi:hypothetical protein